MKSTIYRVTLLLIVSSGIAFAQSKPPSKPTTPPPRTAKLRLITRVSPDSVILRWAPTTSGGWLAANAQGYELKRVTIGSDGKPVQGSTKSLTPTPLKPWSLTVWKQRAPRTDKYAAIAAQALYGKNFASQGNGINTGKDMRNAADELTNRYAFSLVAADNDAVAAEGLALRYADHDVKRGFTYIYRLTLARRDSTYRVDTAFALASPEAFKPSPPVIGLSAESQEHAVELTWQNLPLGKSYSGFYVSRSEDGGKRFTRLNSAPFTFQKKGNGVSTTIYYTDTTAVNYRHYRYRVEGVTPFAELSEPAEVEGFAGDRTPPPPPIIAKPIELSPRAFKITWEMPNTSRDLAGFAIYRSEFALKGYHLIYPHTDNLERARQLLLPVQTRSYVDSPTVAREPYYIVGAVDTAGNMAQSLPTYGEIIDSTPPAVPTGLTGTIDSTGLVHLRWRLGPEPNIIGYRIVWANDPSHEFSMLTNEAIPDTMFVDSISLNTLTRSIYYKVIAVNARKIFSKPSAMLSLRRPDIVPPESPIFTDVRVTDSTVSLVWNPSRSPDVRNHLLSRRGPDEGHWTLLASLGRNVDAFVDHKVVQRTTYEYQIEAVDSTGLHSRPSPVVTARPYDTGVRPEVVNLKAEKDPKTKQITLTWQYHSARNEKFWFVIYRGVGSGALLELGSVDSAQRLYRDDRASAAGSYRYAVKVMGEGGLESPLSPPVTVTQ